MARWFVLGLLVCFVYAAKITSLPGIEVNQLAFGQYSGYIVLNQQHNESMFYWYVESQNNPSKDPLLVWLQGGPGCSGMIGFFQEHGPFLIQTDGTLTLNQYSWNKLANVVYIESPVGVGFSFSDDQSDYNTNDNTTAANNYQFLQGFFQEFPHLLSNPIWITGESYGGVYGPMLANEILEGSNSQIFDQFQGFSLGNPVTSCPALKRQVLTLSLNMYYWNGVLPLSGLRKWTDSECDSGESSSECLKLYENITSVIGAFEGDELYYNFCTQNGSLNLLEQVPNCEGLADRTAKYLNRADVQEALFVKPQVWTACANPRLNYRMQGQNMMEYYEKFFQQVPQWQIMIYSGDIDIATVPHAYTQLCVESLHRPVVSSWRPWKVSLSESGQNVTAGYVEVYDRMTFATVKGAGHEVPTYQPATSFEMFQRFIIDRNVGLN